MKRGMTTRRGSPLILASLLTIVSIVLLQSPVLAGGESGPTPVRFATFNASLNRSNAGDLVAELSAPGSPQPDVIAEIIQRTRPEVLLINEFDYDADGLAAQGFLQNYLGVPHGDAPPPTWGPHGDIGLHPPLPARRAGGWIASGASRIPGTFICTPANGETIA